MKTMSQIYIMLVFAVKYRRALIVPEIREHLYNMLGKLITDHGKGSIPLRIGGIDDHVHILVGLSPRISVEDLCREIKSRSSRWINEQHFLRYKFEWQRGYGVFSYSHSAKNQVIRYIDGQENHHAKIPFIEEFKTMMEKFELISDSRDLPQEPI
ncbi:MAG: IS200/IS605 family transposase [Muribaculaceae bacterium]|nr:IS200/IS605 family transposase [Muribaculaceae bacterium]